LIAARLGFGLVELKLRCLPEQQDAQRAGLALLAREAAMSSFALMIDVSAA
jgi:hypothetical protein